MASEPPRGSLVGYTREKKLGRGAFGEVELYRRTADGSLFAVKRVPLAELDPEAVTTVRREVEALQELNHPCILRYQDAFEDAVEEALIIITEFCELGDCQKLLTRMEGGVWPASHAPALIRGVLQALRYMHLEGTMHRDIKPANILWSDHDHMPRVADFGLARQLATASVAKTVAGTPAFMAPEIFRGAEYAGPAAGAGADAAGGSDDDGYTAAADVWSAGATFWALLAGKPFASSWPQIMAVSRADPATWRPPPLPASVPRDIASLVEEMLRITPTDRPDIKVLLQRPVLRAADARPGPLPLKPLPAGAGSGVGSSARASVGSAAAAAASGGAMGGAGGAASTSGSRAAAAGADATTATASASVSASVSFPSPDMSLGALGAALFGGGGSGEGPSTGSVMLGSLALPSPPGAAASPALVSAATSAAPVAAVSVSGSAAAPAALSRGSSVEPAAAAPTPSAVAAGAAAMPAATSTSSASGSASIAVGGAGSASASSAAASPPSAAAAAAAGAAATASGDGRIAVVSWAMWSLAKVDGHLYVWTTAAPPPAPGGAAVAFWEASPGWMVFQEGAAAPLVQYTDGTTALQAGGFRAQPWNRMPSQLAVTEVTNSQLLGALQARCARGTHVTACGPGGFVLEQEGDAKVAFLADGRMLRAHGSQDAPLIPGVGGAGAVPLSPAPAPAPAAAAAAATSSASPAAAAAAPAAAAAAAAPARRLAGASSSSSASSASASASASASEPLPEALAIGTRVVRGPSWKWQSQDGGAGKEGVVVEATGVAASMDTSGWVWVRWDANGAVNSYRYRPAKSIYDVQPASLGTAAAGSAVPGSATSTSGASSGDDDDEPRLANGTRVVRGPTWRWDMQDGGAGKAGTVVPAPKAHADKKRVDLVWVHWDATDETNCYQYLPAAGAEDVTPMSAAAAAAANPGGHAGEWRSLSRPYWCSLPAEKDGMLCAHGDGIINDSHWSCCGKRSKDEPCPRR